jgi:hypothetical protein
MLLSQPRVCCGKRGNYGGATLFHPLQELGDYEEEKDRDVYDIYLLVRVQGGGKCR